MKLFAVAAYSLATFVVHCACIMNGLLQYVVLGGKEVYVHNTKY